MATQPLQSISSLGAFAPRDRLRGFGTWLNSEYDVLDEVLVASPQHLRLLPSNRVSEEALQNGGTSCAIQASAQHAGLVAALRASGATVHIVPTVKGLPDLSFTRDSTFMTPWGLLGLRPGAIHRRAEVEIVLQAARPLELPILGRVAAGCVEGGDICILRPGHVAVGISGGRTDSAGAKEVGDVFVQRGWSVTYTPIDPHLLHLDTHFCMLDKELALGCIEKLDASLLEQVAKLDIEIVPVYPEELATLGCNVLSLGRKRILSAGSAPRVDELIRNLGFEVLTVALEEFTQCGGGVHCLTMPIRRRSQPWSTIDRRRGINRAAADGA